MARQPSAHEILGGVVSGAIPLAEMYLNATLHEDSGSGQRLTQMQRNVGSVAFGVGLWHVSNDLEGTCASRLKSIMLHFSHGLRGAGRSNRRCVAELC